MLPIGVQTQNVVTDDYPEEGFALLRRVGFTAADFSINRYLKNTTLNQYNKNTFFDK